MDLLAQNGITTFVIDLCLLLAGIGTTITLLSEDRKGIKDNQSYPYLALGVTIVAFYTFIVLLLDGFAAISPQDDPNSIANGIAAVLFALGAIAAFGLFVKIVTGKRENRNLEATAILLLAPIFGFIATTLWLFAESAHQPSAYYYLACVAAIACLILTILIGVTVAVVAYVQVTRSRASSSG